MDRYEEALRRAKELYDAGNFLTKQQMGIVFPELAESEDERIRKEIVDYFTFDNWSSIQPYTREQSTRFLAWLEKQKEIPMPNSTELIEMWDNEKVMLKEKDFRDDAWRLAYNAFMDGFARGTCVKFEKQKEPTTEELYAEAGTTEKEYIANTMKQVRAFREKQKEKPKSTDSISSDCASDVKCEDRSPKHSDSDGTDIRDTPAYWRGWDDAMKQKEQKPADLPPGFYFIDLDGKKYYSKEFRFGDMKMKVVEDKQEKPAELETLGKPMTHKEWAEDYWEHHKFASPNGNDKCDVIQFGHKGFIDFCIAYCIDQKPQDRLVLHDTFGYEKGRQVGQREGVGMVLKTPESYGLYKPAEWSDTDNIGWDEAFACVTRAEKAAKNEEELQNAVTAEKWLKEIKFMYCVHPIKQEWSEEERIRKRIKLCLAECVHKDIIRDYEHDEAIAWLEKQKEPDCLEKFIRLPHLNSDYEVVDDWAYTPSLAHCDGSWGVCWVHCEDGDTLHQCIGDTPAEAIDKAVEWFTSLEKPIRAKEVGAIISSRDKEETACGYLEICLTPDM